MHLERSGLTAIRAEIFRDGRNLQQFAEQFVNIFVLRDGSIAIENVTQKCQLIVNGTADNRGGQTLVTVHRMRAHRLQVSKDAQLHGFRSVLSEFSKLLVVIAQFDHMETHQHPCHQQGPMFGILMH